MLALNMAGLEKKDPGLAAALGGVEAASLTGEGAGVDEHLQTVTPGSTGLAVFIGMGLGEGPLAVLRERPELEKIVILEPSLAVLRQAMERTDLTPLFSSPKVTIQAGEIDFDRYEDEISRVAAVDHSYVLRHVESFQAWPETYIPVSERAYDIVNKINMSGSTTDKLGPMFFANRLENCARLPHLHLLDTLQGSCAGVPAVLVAAGPSLDRSITALREIRNRCVLIAVDSAVVPLTRQGIMPDFVTTLDMSELNFEKVAPLVGKSWDFSLVSLVTVNPMVPKRLRGRHQFLAFTDDLPHRWMLESLAVKNVVPACFSVAQLSFGVAQVLGAEPIILVGQDLAYTSDSSDHAAGTVIAGAGLPKNMEHLQVEAIGGGGVVTTRNLLGIKKLFEEAIAQWPGRVVNATAAGARIEGAPSVDLAEMAASLAPLERPVPELIDHALAQAPAVDVRGFAAVIASQARRCREVAGKIERNLALGDEIQARLSREERENAVRFRQGITPATGKKLAAFDQLNGEIDAEQELWNQVMEVTYSMLRDNDLKQRRNLEQREEIGIGKWIRAEIDRIARVNRFRQQTLIDYAMRLEKMQSVLETAEVKKADPAAVLERYADQGEYALAYDLLAGNGDVRGAAAMVRAGEVCAALLRFDEAWEWWDRAVAHDASMAAAVDTVRLGQVASWVEIIKQRLDPVDPDKRFPGILTAWLGRIRHLLRDDEAPPGEVMDLWQEYEAHVVEWTDQGEGEAAAAILEAWTQLSPWLPGVEAQLGRLLISEGHFDDGVGWLQNAVRRDSAQAMIWAEVGDAVLQTGDLDGAIAAYEQCFLALPERSDMLWKMGDCYQCLGRVEAAREAYEACLRRDPQCREARDGIGRLQKM